MSLELVQAYANDIAEKYKSGQATEHTYRAELERLLRGMGGRNAQVINEPKRHGGNAPDYIVQRDLLIIGFVEAKDIDKNLDVVEQSEQLARYLAAYPNLILTNYLEFRWYIDGEWSETVSIGQLNGKSIRFDEEAYLRLSSLLGRYYEATAPVIYRPEDLAQRMAKMARELARLIDEALENPTEGSDLPAKKEAVEKVLLPNQTNREFADMYAQTIAYGLFAARAAYHGKPELFTLERAFFELPKTNPFLRKLFQNIAAELDKRVKFMADTIAQLLGHAKGIDDIISNFGQSSKQKQDPVIHFYETFLTAYNPQQREQRGVYYTPEPVVSYIVRSVDAILRDTFGRVDGLADTNTLILDPATGTGTFLYHVIQQIHDSMGGNKGMWSSYVQQHLLPRIFGFELLMAPYAVAHMKLNLLLESLGYDFSKEDRLEIYLTNTLEENVQQPPLPFAEYLTDEANAATRVKREKPIMVILGNPPYSYDSSNTGDWIGDLTRDYYQVDGKPLDEANPRGLQDDYVKFIRFGQWRIEQTGSGVLGFVTNHGYLDNPTFRGMRASLMKSFSDIYILDLHGNDRRREIAPDGRKDVNVFDIQTGVCITLFVRGENHRGNAKVHHMDLFASRRSEKYAWLSENNMESHSWQQLKPQSPSYLFVPQNVDLREEYNSLWNLPSILTTNSVGFYTARDRLAIQDTEQKMEETAKSFVGVAPEVARSIYELGADSRDWQVALAQNDVLNTDVSSDLIVPVSYRPFDTKYTYYTGNSRGFICMPRSEVMQHLLNKTNVAVCFMRRSREGITSNFFAVDHITDKTILSSADNAYVAPLYLYAQKQEGQLFELEDDGSAWPLSEKGRRPNLNPDFIKELSQKIGLDFITEGTGDLQSTYGPEDVFHYAYAVFHSPTYRDRYAEFLKIDFPRLPLTSDVNLFRLLCAKGAELVQWHLLTHPGLGKLTVSYPVNGSNEVIARHPRYDEKTQRVYINAEQYFEPVPQEVWEFYIGGYQVLEKWLKDRRGRTLDFSDVRHYERIVKALQETMRLMEEIDEAIPDWPLV